MSEGTLQPTTDKISTSVFDVEYSSSLVSGTARQAIKLSDFPKVSTLKSLYASVVVNSVEAEVRQDTLLGDEENAAFTRGHVFVAIIPTVKDTDSASGSTKAIINNVPNKQTFPLSSTIQNNCVFHFNLNGYELDLAQDPRRGAGPVAWIGNSGIVKRGEKEVQVCTVTWRLKVACSGTTPLWN